MGCVAAPSLTHRSAVTATRGLHPAGLDQLGIVAALRGPLADVEVEEGLATQFTMADANASSVCPSALAQPPRPAQRAGPEMPKPANRLRSSRAPTRDSFPHLSGARQARSSRRHRSGLGRLRRRRERPGARLQARAPGSRNASARKRDRRSRRARPCGRSWPRRLRGVVGLLRGGRLAVPLREFSDLLARSEDLDALAGLRFPMLEVGLD